MQLPFVRSTFPRYQIKQFKKKKKRKSHKAIFIAWVQSVVHTFDLRGRGRGRLISEFQAIQSCIVRPFLKNKKLKTS